MRKAYSCAVNFPNLGVDYLIIYFDVLVTPAAAHIFRSSIYPSRVVMSTLVEELATALPAFRKDHPIVTGLEVLRTRHRRVQFGGHGTQLQRSG